MSIPSRFRSGEDGMAITEFAFIAMLFFTLAIATIEFAYGYYLRGVLTGAVNEAGRASTLAQYTDDQSALDAKVTQQVQQLAPKAQLTFSRRSFEQFADINKPEEFADANANGVRDPGECFADANGNSRWDPNRQRVGNGGAGDVVYYIVRATVPVLTPARKMIGISDDTFTVTARTILRNQPFAVDADQTVSICT